MKKFKYHVGFPVDCKGSEKPHFLLYPAKNCSKHYVSTPHSEKREEFDNPPHWGELSKFLKVCSYFDFHCSVGNTNISGNSAMLAYAIAGNSENIANPEDKNSPYLFFSASLNFTPSATDISLSTIDIVTDDDQEVAKNSLNNKWKTIKKISEEKKVALFLHLKDWKKLKMLIDKNAYSEKYLADLTGERFFGEIKSSDVPLVVAVESEDICKILELLEIKKKEKNEKNYKKAKSYRNLSLDEKLKIDDQNRKIKKIIDEEILNLEKELLDESKFEKFIKDSVEKTVKETEVTRFNVFLKKEEFKNSIDKNIVPKIKEYLETRMNQYKENIKKRVKNIDPEEIDLKKMRVGDNVSSEASSSVAASIGTALASAVGAAISSAFLTTTTWLIFTTTNPIGWAAMIVFGFFALFFSGKFIFLSLEELIIKVIGPGKHIISDGIIYKLWHEGFENDGNKTEALKKEREKDYDRVISELEKNGFKDLL